MPFSSLWIIKTAKVLKALHKNWIMFQKRLSGALLILVLFVLATKCWHCQQNMFHSIWVQTNSCGPMHVQPKLNKTESPLMHPRKHRDKMFKISFKPLLTTDLKNGQRKEIVSPRDKPMGSDLLEINSYLHCSFWLCSQSKTLVQIGLCG